MNLIGRPRTYRLDRPATNAERQRRYRAHLAPRPRKVYHTGKSTEWETPQPFFDALQAEFGFTLDVAATPSNAKCPRYFTQEDNGLLQDWTGEICYMNPPYGKDLAQSMSKAFTSAQHGATVVCLVPARTEMHWWHAYAMQGEIRFVQGRLKFGGSPHNAPFPNAVVIFRSS